MDPIAESPGDALTKLLQEPKTTHHPSSPPRGHHRNKLRPHHQIPLSAQIPHLPLSGNIPTSRRSVPSALQEGNRNDSRRRGIVELLDCVTGHLNDLPRQIVASDTSEAEPNELQQTTFKIQQALRMIEYRVLEVDIQVQTALRKWVYVEM